VETTPSTKTTSTAPTSKTTTTRSPVPTTRSETLTLALLGTGAVLMLAGAFYGRIHSLTGPGGIGIQLQDVAASASDTNDGIKKLQKVSASQKTAIKAALKNIDELNGRIAELEKRTGGAL